MTTWTGSELPPPPDFFTQEKALPKLTRKDKRLDRIPLTPAHRRLRVVAGTLATVLVLALLAIAALVGEYKSQNQALTQCFASADANYWAALAGKYDAKGEASDAKYAAQQSMRALSPLGQNNIDAAMKSCTAQFYGAGLR